MQAAQTYLEVVRSRGKRRLKLERVYHNLKNRELFLKAYGKLYANAGATTTGTDPGDTVDAMSLKRIDRIIESLKAGSYQWKPARRVYIPKKNGKMRPLGIPGWNDKLLQEVLRMVLSEYYEPQFSDCSHGFRPNRGCHTALQSIYPIWKGTKWFIEGDIKGCFDNINHEILLNIIRRNVEDDRLLKLLKGMLEAGYVEDWRYERTYSGTPQGGVISPLLANIFLNELDTFVETILLPKYNRGDSRRQNPEYIHYQSAMQSAKTKGLVEQYMKYKKKRNQLPSGDPNDPDYRRLRYVRYADDFLLGFVGTKIEAEGIKGELRAFIASLGLEMSVEKTFITHATTDQARFLGYNIQMAKADSRKDQFGRRSINGQPILRVPKEVVMKWKRKYLQDGKPFHRAELIDHSDYDIVVTYGLEFQGLANYYAMAHNVSILYSVKWAFMYSLAKTLAAKHKTSVAKVMRKYGYRTDEGIKAVAVKVEREGKKPLIATFGAKPIRFCKTAVIADGLSGKKDNRNELVDRLLANTCEICGSKQDIQVHHIKKLADLTKRYQSRKQPPEWVKRMIEIRRKTLVVCQDCHTKIHAGQYDGARLKEGLLESRVH